MLGQVLLSIVAQLGHHNPVIKGLAYMQVCLPLSSIHSIFSFSISSFLT